MTLISGSCGPLGWRDPVEQKNRIRTWLRQVVNIYFNHQISIKISGTKKLLIDFHGLHLLDPRLLWTEMCAISQSYQSLGSVNVLISLTAYLCQVFDDDGEFELSEFLWGTLQSHLGLTSLSSTQFYTIMMEVVDRKAKFSTEWLSRIEETKDDPRLFLLMIMTFLLVKNENTLSVAREILKNAEHSSDEQLNAYWCLHDHLILDVLGIKAFPFIGRPVEIDERLFCQIIDLISGLEDGLELLEKHSLLVHVLGYAVQEELSDTAVTALTKFLSFFRFFKDKKIQLKLSQSTVSRLLNTPDKKTVLNQLMGPCLIKDEYGLARSREILQEAEKTGVDGESLGCFWLDHHNYALDLEGEVALERIKSWDCLNEELIIRIVSMCSKQGYDLLVERAALDPFVNYLSSALLSTAMMKFLILNKTFIFWLSQRKVVLEWSRENVKCFHNVNRTFEHDVGIQNIKDIQSILSEESKAILYDFVISQSQPIEKLDLEALNRATDVYNTFQVPMHQLEKVCARISYLVTTKKLVAFQEFDPFFWKWIRLTNKSEKTVCYPLDALVVRAIENKFPPVANFDSLFKFSIRIANDKNYLNRAILFVAQILSTKPRPLPELLLERFSLLVVKDVSADDVKLRNALLVICRQAKETAGCKEVFKKLLLLIQAAERSVPGALHPKLMRGCFDLGTHLKVWENAEYANLVTAFSNRIDNEFLESVSSLKVFDKVKRHLLKLLEEIGVRDSAKKTFIKILLKLLQKKDKQALALVRELLKMPAVHKLAQDKEFSDVLIAYFEEKSHYVDKSDLDELMSLLFLYQPRPEYLWETVSKRMLETDFKFLLEKEDRFFFELTILSKFFDSLAGTACKKEVLAVIFLLNKKIVKDDTKHLVFANIILYRLVCMAEDLEQGATFLNEYFSQVIDHRITPTEDRWVEINNLYHKTTNADFKAKHAALQADLELNYYFCLILSRKATVFGDPIFKNILRNQRVPLSSRDTENLCVKSTVDAACENINALVLLVPSWLATIEEGLKSNQYNSFAVLTILIRLCHISLMNFDGQIVRCLRLCLGTESKKEPLLHLELIKAIVVFVADRFDHDRRGGKLGVELLHLHLEMIHFGYQKKVIEEKTLNEVIEQFGTMLIFYNISEIQRQALDYSVFWGTINKYSIKLLQLEKPGLMKSSSPLGVTKGVDPHFTISIKSIFSTAVCGYSRWVACNYNVGKTYLVVSNEIRGVLSNFYAHASFKEPDIQFKIKEELKLRIDTAYVKLLLSMIFQEIDLRRLVLFHVFDKIVTMAGEHPKNKNGIFNLCEEFMHCQLARLSELEGEHSNLCYFLVLILREINATRAMKLKFQLFLDPEKAIPSIRSSEDLKIVYDVFKRLLDKPSLTTMKKVLSLCSRLDITLETKELFDSYLNGYTYLINVMIAQEQSPTIFFRELPNSEEAVLSILNNDEINVASKISYWRSLLLYHVDIYNESEDRLERLQKFPIVLNTLMMGFRKGWCKNDDLEFVTLRDEIKDSLLSGFNLLCACISIDIDELPKTATPESLKAFNDIVKDYKKHLRDLSEISRVMTIEWKEIAFQLWNNFLSLGLKFFPLVKSSTFLLREVSIFFYTAAKLSIFPANEPFLYGKMVEVLNREEVQDCYELTEIKDSVFEWYLKVLALGKEGNSVIFLLRANLFVYITSNMLGHNNVVLHTQFIKRALELDVNIASEYNQRMKS